MSKSNLDEYIKRGEAIEALEDDYKLCFAVDPTIEVPYYKMKRAAIRVISGVHAANVAPVVKGEWQESPIGDYTIFYKCSVCNGYGHIWDDFCPNCGAAMTDEALRILAERNKWGDTEGEE